MSTQVRTGWVIYSLAASGIVLGILGIAWSLMSGEPERPREKGQIAEKPKPPKKLPSKQVNDWDGDIVPTGVKLVKQPLGTLEVVAAHAEIEEGCNVDLQLTIHNTVENSRPYLLDPSPEYGSIGYRVKKTAPEVKDAFETFPDGVKAASGGDEAYYGRRFLLEGGKARDFPLQLFDDRGWGSSLSWLEPGTYEIQVLYRSPPEGSPFQPDKRIDFSKTIASLPITLTIKAPPPGRKAAVAAARKFLNAGIYDQIDEFIKSYQQMQSQMLLPSLEKRVRLHAAVRIWAKSMKPALVEMSIQELLALTKKDLTTGEADRVHSTLTRYYYQLDNYKAAYQWTQGHTTPWAEEMRQKIPKALVGPGS